MCVYFDRLYAWSNYMRINIVIDDELMNLAIKTSGLSTKKEVVEEGLRLLVKVKKQKRLKMLKGQLTWEGNLDKLRAEK